VERTLVLLWLKSGQVQYAIVEFRERVAVTDAHDDGVPRRRAQEAVEPCFGGTINGRRSLVQEHARGFRKQDAGESQALLFAGR
jgi:hypothetical protein